MLTRHPDAHTRIRLLPDDDREHDQRNIVLLGLQTNWELVRLHAFRKGEKLCCSLRKYVKFLQLTKFADDADKEAHIKKITEKIPRRKVHELAGKVGCSEIVSMTLKLFLLASLRTYCP